MSSITSYIILTIVIPSLMFALPALPAYQNIQTPFRNATEAKSAAVYICERCRFFFELTEGGNGSALFIEAFGENGQLFGPSSDIRFANNQGEQTTGYTAIQARTALIRDSLSFRGTSSTCEQALAAATVIFTNYAISWTAYHDTHLEEGSHAYEQIISSYFIKFDETGTVDILIPISHDTIEDGEEEFWDMCFDFNQSNQSINENSTTTNDGTTAKTWAIDWTYVGCVLLIALLVVNILCLTFANCKSKRSTAKYSKVISVDTSDEEAAMQLK